MISVGGPIGRRSGPDAPSYEARIVCGMIASPDSDSTISVAGRMRPSISASSTEFVTRRKARTSSSVTRSSPEPSPTVTPVSRVALCRVSLLSTADVRVNFRLAALEYLFAVFDGRIPAAALMKLRHLTRRRFHPARAGRLRLPCIAADAAHAASTFVDADDILGQFGRLAFGIRPEWL